MSAINNQDNIIKSPLVQQMQHRAEDMARVQTAHEHAQKAENVREADEVILEIKQTEQQGIHDDDDERRERRRQAAESEPAEGEGESEDTEATDEATDKPVSADGQRHIDITI